MFAKTLPAATAAVLLLLAAGCETAGSKKASEPAAATSSKASLSAQAAASSIPSSPAERRADRVYAYVDEVRADLSDGKTALINQIMRLSKDEAAIFWPLYHDYEEEL